MRRSASGPHTAPPSAAISAENTWRSSLQPSARIFSYSAIAVVASPASAHAAPPSSQASDHNKCNRVRRFSKGRAVFLLVVQDAV